MQNQDYISEQDACLRAGVSSNTLRRFAEAGYFNTKVGQNGEVLYPFRHLAQLLSLDESSESAAAKETASKDIEEASVTELPVFANTVNEKTPEELKEKVVEITLSSNENSGIETTENTIPFSSKSSPSLNFSKAIPEYTSEPQQSRASIPDFSQRLFARQLESKIQEAEKELVRYRNVSNMQEKLLDIREKEIEDLRSQRDWLKTRVQSLEDQSNRFQVLMLNEMQMTSKLIRLQMEKKSGVSRALQWLGIGSGQQEDSQEERNKSRTIVGE